MKELYISPVLNVLCFAPVERLASIEFKDLLQAGNISADGDAEKKDETSNDGDDWVFNT